MNTQKQTNSKAWRQIIAACVMAAIYVAGCKTAGYHKHDAASVNSQDAAATVRQEGQQLEVAIGYLGELVNQTSGDAKPQYERFSATLDRLEKSKKSAAMSVGHLQQKRAAYFETWDKEIALIRDDEIRRTSEERRNEVGRSFDAAVRELEGSQQKLDPLILYLRDIRKALSADLAREGLVAVRPAYTNASERAADVQKALNASAKELDGLSERISSVMPQETK